MPIRSRLVFASLFLCLIPAGAAAETAAGGARVVVFGTNHRTIPRGAPIRDLDEVAYSQDLSEIVAKAAGLKYRIVEMDSWDQILKALADGTIDVIPTIARIPERDGQMLFSVPHVRGALVAVMRTEDARTATVESLNGKRIAVRFDSVNYRYVETKGWLKDALVIRSGDGGEELRRVADGGADVTIMNEFSAIGEISRLGLKSRLSIAFTLPDSVSEFCMAVRPTDGALLSQLNDGLFLAAERGDLQRNYEKWFYGFETAGALRASLRQWLIFGGGGAALLVLLGWGSFRYRLRAAGKREREVQGMVEKRTDELAAANRRLRFSEEKFSKAFMASPDAMCITEVSDEAFIDINESFTRIFGYERPEVIGKTAVGLGLWNSPTDRERLMEALAGEGRVRNALHLFRRNGGEIRTGLVSMERIKIGVTDCTVSIVRDITESEQASAALRESEARFRTLVESAPEAIVVFDAHSRQLTDANENALRLFDATRGELLAADIDRISPSLQPDGRPSDTAIRDLIRRTLAGETPAVEWVAQSLRGRPIVVELRLVRLPAADRNLVRGSLTDISERKRLEEQLRQAQRMESIGQLAGGVAHDFNNILTVIQCNTSLLLSDEKFPKAYHEAIEQIEHSSTFAAGLTRQLLVFGRKQLIQRVSINAASAVQQTSGLLGRVIGENIALDVQVPADLPPIFGDIGMLEQVLLNLAVNARDAMPNGGRLTIRAGLVDRDEAYRRRVPQALSGRFICIAVTDTGTGISPEILPRIYDPFFTTKEVGKGTGLGLATVYGIVQQHQGWIELETRVGVGTEFRVHFPCIAGTQAAAPAAGAAGSRGPHSETILVIEDESSVRLTSCSILQSQGYVVLEAASSQAALALWETNRERINLVFTDVVMPGAMTGRDIVERMRRDRPELKALFTSGYSSDLLGRDFVRTSANFFLQKPFGAAELKRVVNECLRAG